MSTEARIVLTTTGSNEESQRIASHLVEQGVAACVNILPGATSIYRWQGAVETATEEMLVIKTTVAQLGALQSLLIELHSYEVPEFVVIAVESAAPAYLDWLTGSIK